MKRVIIVLAYAASLAGCGDTIPGNTGADVPADTAAKADLIEASIGPDVVADMTVVRDASADAVPDVPPDATRDVGFDARAEVVTDAPTDTARDTTLDASGCSGSAPACVSGTAGGTCSDALTVATCERGAWRCMDGMVFVSECRCIGRPPGRDCTCGPSGWICGDAGATDAGALLDCDPSHVACDARPPMCAGGGEVPSVSGACWGPCVVFTRCAPIPCDPAGPTSQCPTNLTCFRTTRMCGPFL